MISHKLLTEKRILPFTKQPLRFAVGDPAGITSNSWKIWTKKGDIYIACRDNFKYAKVSLHVSGRWRMGFTTTGIQEANQLNLSNENRAWDVWDSPPDQLPNTKIAFRLFFSQKHLAVVPEQRDKKEWSNVLFIEAPPEGKLTAISLFITENDMPLVHKSEPSFCLASFQLGNSRFAKIIAHGEPEGNIPKLIELAVAEARQNCITSSVDIPKGAYGYFFGKLEDGSRFLVGSPFD